MHRAWVHVPYEKWKNFGLCFINWLILWRLSAEARENPYNHLDHFPAGWRKSWIYSLLAKCTTGALIVVELVLLRILTRMELYWNNVISRWKIAVLICILGESSQPNRVDRASANVTQCQVFAPMGIAVFWIKLCIGFYPLSASKLWTSDAEEKLHHRTQRDLYCIIYVVRCVHSTLNI